MTEEKVDLGKRSVACKGWRWMPGMRTADAMRVIHDPDRWPDRPCAILEGSWVDTAPPRPLGDNLPDLTDPATLGCLLALVRKAWGDPYLCAVGDPDTGWRIDAVTAQVRDLHGYASEANALVFALERSP